MIPRIVRALLYSMTVFISFFLMLVFMTYNVSLKRFSLDYAHYRRMCAGILGSGDSAGRCHWPLYVWRGDGPRRCIGRDQ
jgi:hypothetical protein